MNGRPVLFRSVMAAAISVTLFCAAGASAGPKRSKSPYAAQVMELRAIRRVLQQADQDYKGHRVAAIRQINIAARILGPAPAVRKGHPGKTPKGNQEPQVLSDAQLRQAVADLQAVQGQLQQLPGPRPAKAILAVGQAIKELSIALQIR